MGKIEKPMRVWDNGAVCPFDIASEDPVAELDNFFRISGAKEWVATRWWYQGKRYEDKRNPVPIPDLSGLVVAEDEGNKWKILDPRGVEKNVIPVPKINEFSNPTLGYLGQPRHMPGTPAHIMYGEGSDGNLEGYRFFFNMHTGTLVEAELVGRHW